MNRFIILVVAFFALLCVVSCNSKEENNVLPQEIKSGDVVTYRLPFEADSKGAEVVDYNYSENDSTPRIILIHALDSANNPTSEVIGRLYLYKNQETFMGGSEKNNKRDGLWQAFYEDGTIWSETMYKEGVEDGFSRTFYENGKLRYEGNYAMGKQVGDWNFYDESGNLTQTETYDNEGQLVSKK